MGESLTREETSRGTKQVMSSETEVDCHSKGGGRLS